MAKRALFLISVVTLFVSCSNDTTYTKTRWWPNGQKRSEYHYANGEFHGVSRDWTADGKLIRQMNYVDGHESGLQQLWDDDGTLRANYVARNGRNYGLTGIKSCVSAIH